MEAPRKDAERLKTALKAHGAAGAFLTAASPGVTAFFFRNEYYRTHEDYVFAIAEAMRDEYETIAAAGVTLQVDCPDLAMGRHTQFKDLDLAGFRERMELNVEALNRALVNIPAGQVRMHLCWGNYPGPHPLRRAASGQHSCRIGRCGSGCRLGQTRLARTRRRHREPKVLALTAMRAFICSIVWWHAEDFFRRSSWWVLRWLARRRSNSARAFRRPARSRRSATTCT